MTRCKLSHRYDATLKTLPEDQGGEGRHKCAACAYKRGYQYGFALQEAMTLDLHSLPESQAGTVRHKSPHAAFALGYLKGVEARYGKEIV